MNIRFDWSRTSGNSLVDLESKRERKRYKDDEPKKIKCKGCGDLFRREEEGGFMYCIKCLREYKEHKSPDVLGRKKDDENE